MRSDAIAPRGRLIASHKATEPAVLNPTPARKEEDVQTLENFVDFHLNLNKREEIDGGERRDKARFF